jgi:uncharacterized protein (TIGR04255 family)
MSLPEPDRTPLAAPPLLVMLCQVRYDARDDLASGAAAGILLKQLSRLGLASMTQIHQQQVVVIAGPAAEQIGHESPSQPAGWQFTDESNTTTLNILTDQMTLETRVYLGWEDFFTTWEGCLDALAAGSRPSVSTRLGLRYVNRVTSRRARNVIDFRANDLVDPAFLGPVGGSPLSDHVTATEGRATLKFPDGTEALVQHGAVSSSPTPAFVLDIDCFRSTAAEFDKHALLGLSATLNERALQIFQTVVRPSLRDEMKYGEKAS